MPRRLPRLKRAKVFIPKRPGSALKRPHRINCTAAPAAAEIRQKNAVFGSRMLNETKPKAHPTDILFPKDLRRDFQVLRRPLKFSPRQPDVSFLRPRTAPPAADTRKPQTLCIPLVGPNVHQSHFSTAPVSALVAIAAYLARQPPVIRGGRGFHCAFRRFSSSVLK